MTENMMGMFRGLLRIWALTKKQKGYLNLKPKLHFSARNLEKGTETD